MHKESLSENFKVRDNADDLGVDARIILDLTLEK
jgi:hypothetical protein